MADRDFEKLDELRAILSELGFVSGQRDEDSGNFLSVERVKYLISEQDGLRIAWEDAIRNGLQVKAAEIERYHAAKTQLDLALAVLPEFPGATLLDKVRLLKGQYLEFMAGRKPDVIKVPMGFKIETSSGAEVQVHRDGHFTIKLGGESVDIIPENP